MGGGGSTYDYGFRIYNPNIAKFLSVDPLSKEYPELTSYQFASNSPIAAVDLDGLESDISFDPTRYNNSTDQTSVSRVHLPAPKLIPPTQKQIIESRQIIPILTGKNPNEVGDRIVSNWNKNPVTVSDIYACYPSAWVRLQSGYTKVPNQLLVPFSKNPNYKPDPDRLFPALNTKFAVAFASAIDSKLWKDIPQDIKGKGGAGAVVMENLGEIADVWAGEMQKGGIIQVWQYSADFEDVKNGLPASRGYGHSVTFLNYTFDSSGDISGFKYADQNGEKTAEKGNYAEVFGANLKNEER